METKTKEFLLKEVEQLRRSQSLVASELVSLRRQVVQNVVKINNISYEHKVHGDRLRHRADTVGDKV
jgi:hypothetical protein